MIILSLNAGSSSLKFMVYDYAKESTLATGIVERVTVGGSFIKYTAKGHESVKIESPCPTHKEAIQLLMNSITGQTPGAVGVLKSMSEISAVGHRAVHGGEKFNKSVVIDEHVIQTLKDLYDLAPLHNPANVMGIEAAREVLPKVPHMAIFDTAWHETMPEHAFLYALPYEYYSKYKLRRYGFHGTSFLYVAKRTAVLLGKDPFKTNCVIAHIGNGASINAVKNGCSYDTSMGLTPLEGLVMGTRAGDHDPAIDLYIMEKEKRSLKEMNDILNKKSGVLGITEKYTDRRDIEIAAEQGDKRAQLAIDMEAYRLQKYIGAYTAAIGGTDAIVFTAGVGEMSPIIRGWCCKGLEYMGVKIDPKRNDLAMTRNAETLISTPDSKVKVFVIPTDEERVFIEDVVALQNGTYDVHTKFDYSFQKRDYVNHQRAVDFERELVKRPGRKEIVALPPR